MCETCDRDTANRVMLRIHVAIAASIAATGFVFAFFPGFEVYRHGVLVDTRPVIEQWNWLLGILVILLAPGAIVWRSPRTGYALLWSLWTIAIATLVFVGTFDLGDPRVRTVALWPHAVFGYLMVALLLHLIVVIPIASGAFWWITRDRPVRPTLPVARVLR